MMNIDLKMAPGVRYAEAEEAARNAAMDAGGSVSLLAWYDKAKGLGAPQEACALESFTCVRDYAVHREADFRISVNADAYEFFFTRVPAGTEELDREEVVEVHAGIAEDEFNNVQGG